MADNIQQSVKALHAQGTAVSKLTSESAAAGKMFDSFAPDKPMSDAMSAPFEIRTTDVTVQAQPGSTWTLRTPTTHVLYDTFLVCDIAAPSAGTTAERVGLNVINKITVRSCGTVQELPYRDVMRYVLTNSESDERTALLNAVGGASAAAEAVVVPMPLFWTPHGQGKIRRNHPGLPAFLLSSPVEVEIEMAAQADLLATGGTFAAGAFSKVTVVHLIRQMDTCGVADLRAKGSWAHWGYDFNNAPGVSVPVADTTTLDLRQFNGSSAGIAIFPVLDTNLAANDYYVLENAIHDIQTHIDSARFLPIGSNLSALPTPGVLSYLSHHFGLHRGADAADPTFSQHAVFIPFGGAIESGADGHEAEGTSPAHTGSLNLRAVQTLTVDLENTGSGATTMHPLNVIFARYSINGGLLKREK